ncbi:alpha/beta fold hydrolase [Streptomyces sp. NPDC002734]|uniref:alpha/beta fold hydrolase n=1 Tax=Streptomyces sp. NPDC002734 TaxID=3154426 RepID=UPI00332C29F2
MPLRPSGPPSLYRELLMMRIPIAAAALGEKSTGAAWKAIPSWSLVTTEDLNIPVAAQRFMSARANARTTEVDASHAVTVSRPGAVTRIVEQAAGTVR